MDKRKSKTHRYRSFIGVHMAQLRKAVLVTEDLQTAAHNHMHLATMLTVWGIEVLYNSRIKDGSA